MAEFVTGAEDEGIIVQLKKKKKSYPTLAACFEDADLFMQMSNDSHFQ